LIEASPSSQASRQDNGSGGRPPEIADLLDKAAQLLQEGQPEKAIDLASRARIKSPWVTNLLGVCQLRLGNAKVAVDVFRGLVLAAGGVLLRQDVPTVFKANFATALLANDNPSGFLSVLGEIQDDPHPAVRKLRDGFQRWKASLTLWQRIRWHLGGQPARPFTLDFLPGELE
jgi:hypothetical protein